MTAAAARTAIVYLQELRDGSWIANATWGGRTLTDGGTEVEPVIQRLAARLAAMPDAGRPDSVKLTRVPLAGEREEREQDFASLL